MDKIMNMAINDTEFDYRNRASSSHNMLLYLALLA